MSALNALLSAIKFFPASAGVKMLSKFNPKFKNFFTDVAAYGMDVNRGLDYIVDRFGNSPANQQFNQELEQGAANQTLRPDEMAARQDIANSKVPIRAATTAASLAGAGLLSSFGGEEQAEQPRQGNMLPQGPMGSANVPPANTITPGFKPLAPQAKAPSTKAAKQAQKSPGKLHSPEAIAKALFANKDQGPFDADSVAKQFTVKVPIASEAIDIFEDMVNGQKSAGRSDNMTPELSAAFQAVLEALK